MAQAAFVTKTIQMERLYGFKGVAVLLSVSIAYIVFVTKIIPKKL